MHQDFAPYLELFQFYSVGPSLQQNQNRDMLPAAGQQVFVWL